MISQRRGLVFKAPLSVSCSRLPVAKLVVSGIGDLGAFVNSDTDRRNQSTALFLAQQLSKPSLRHLAVLFCAVNPDVLPSESPGDQGRCAAADEGIEYHASFRRTGQDTRFYQRFRENREMGIAEF